MAEKVNTEFDNDEFSKAYPDGIQNDFWNTARSTLINHYIDKYGINNILDIGCGRGIVTHFLAQKGKEITGVELGMTRPIADGVTIFYNTDAINLPESLRSTISAFLLLDVIEHIEKPDEFINSLLKYFPSVKHIIITVPARKELWSNYDEYYGHFRRYDLKMIDETAEKTGFKVLAKQYFFHSLYPMLLANKRANKKRNTTLSAPTGALSKLVHKSIGWGLFLEAKLLPKTLAGSSVICVLERMN